MGWIGPLVHDRFAWRTPENIGRNGIFTSKKDVLSREQGKTG